MTAARPRVAPLARRRVEALDGLWLSAERPGTVMSVDTLVTTTTPLDLDRLLDVARSRIWERYPAFRSRPVSDADGRWWWLDDPGCDLDDLVTEVGLDHTNDPAALAGLVAGEGLVPLPRDRPMWRAFFVPDYRGGSAVLLRTHHAVADGIRMVQVAMGLFDAAPDGGALLPPPADPPAASSTVDGRPRVALPPVADLRRAAANPLGAAWGVATSAIRGLGDVTGTVLADLDAGRKLVVGTRDDPRRWGAPAGAAPARWVGWTAPVPLAPLRDAAGTAGAKVNDVVLAAVALGLRAYMRRSGRAAPSVAFMVPVNLVPVDPALPQSLGNNFVLVQLELPTSTDDPAEVLRTVRRRTARVKRGHEATIDLLVERGVAALGPTALRTATTLLASRTTGVLSNVPGPPFPVYLAGQRVDDVVGWAPVHSGQAMSLTATSYDGQLVVGVATDPGRVPGSSHLVDDVGAALEQLAALAPPGT